MPKPPVLFKVDGAEWEAPAHGGGIYSLHVELDNGDHFCVWAYSDHSPDNYCCVRYKANQFTGPEHELWLGPLEAQCLVLEALKEKKPPTSSIPTNTKRCS